MEKEKKSKEQHDDELNTKPKVDTDTYDSSDEIEVLKDSTKHAEEEEEKK